MCTSGSKVIVDSFYTTSTVFCKWQLIKEYINAAAESYNRAPNSFVRVSSEAQFNRLSTYSPELLRLQLFVDVTREAPTDVSMALRAFANGPSVARKPAENVIVRDPMHRKSNCICAANPVAPVRAPRKVSRLKQSANETHQENSVDGLPRIDNDVARITVRVSCTMPDGFTYAACGPDALMQKTSSRWHIRILQFAQQRTQYFVSIDFSHRKR